MAQLHRLQQRHNSTTPRTPKSPTVEQFLQGEASAWTGTASPTVLRDHDPELDHHQHHQKQSVLNKVKEKARRWRHTLSKKKHSDTVSTTPSWGVSLEEEDYGEEDPEYLGAPMYESEMAPEGYKDSARQHPRSGPVIQEKHVSHSSLRERPRPNPIMPEKHVSYGGVTDHPRSAPINPEKHVSHSSVQEHPQKEREKEKEKEKEKETQNTPSANPPAKTITATVTEKLVPAYNAVSDATSTIASKISNLSISTAKQSPVSAQTSSSSSAPAASSQSPKFYDAPTSAPAGESNSGKQIWDKGVSVKEYLMQKLEPGDDERALSQVISDAMSPKRAPGDVGVVEKVREAVTSLLRKDDSASSRTVYTDRSSSSQIPVSTNPHEAVEEENHGRILQTN